MAITQLQYVKALPYLSSNILSVFTVQPLAVSIIALCSKYKGLLKNHFLILLGLFSYEIYLIHVFVLPIIEHSVMSLLAFIIVTVFSTFMFHLIWNKGINLFQKRFMKGSEQSID